MSRAPTLRIIGKNLVNLNIHKGAMKRRDQLAIKRRDQLEKGKMATG